MSGFYRLLALLAMFGTLSACSMATGEVSSPSSDPPSGEGRGITIAHSEWEESAAIANLTKVVLEDELGYDEATLEESTPEDAFEMVASGEADVFQGIWRPRHDDLVAEHEGDIEMLGGWLFGTTRASLAAPSYMDIRSLSDLEGAGAERAIVLDGEASGAGEVPAEIFEEYGIEASVYPDSEAMMEEAERLYEDEEPFVMLAYSPHWMNLEYELDYLEDSGGDGLLEDVNRSQTLHSAAREGLAAEDPLARALLGEISFTENQIESLELAIRDAESPSEGVRAWAESNDHLVRLWVHTARDSVG